MIFAHSLPGKSEAEWEPLSHHLRQVGARAEAFAAAFGGAPIAQAMGVLHDIGKRSQAYQRYIRTPRTSEAKVRGPDHSTAGAKEAIRLYDTLGRLMGFGIAGHHSGLMDGDALTERAGKTVEDYTGWEEHAPPLPGLATLLASLGKPRRNAIEPAFSLFFLARMLFSCLVDADFLETERFYAAAEGAAQPGRGGGWTYATVTPFAALWRSIGAMTRPSTHCGRRYWTMPWRRLRWSPACSR